MTRSIVVGSGIAGLMTALYAADAGVHVTLVTKQALSDANTTYAQGGIAAVTCADDSTDAHRDDTQSASAGMADAAAVAALVAGGKKAIDDLVRWGVHFDRDASGTYVKGLEAAHSYPRVLHAGGDATGREIETALIAQVRARDITVLTHTFVDDILITDGRVSGVLVQDSHGGRALHADTVVLATGGAGQLYAHTTNPPVATGDGIAAAIRAGAQTADLEFVQFHPTVLAEGQAFLVSEAVRGEGATLIDDSGRRFCFDAHPAGELAPRDVVARAIARQMARQGGRPVRLDATALGQEFLAARFPTITAAITASGRRWGTEPIPVTPAAHYLMGGVVTDLSGRTSVPGLFAVGEVARTGVHGANRLASNSLLEGAVFAARTADALAGNTDTPWTGPRRDTPVTPSIAEAAPAASVASFTRQRLQALMWQHAGVERTDDGLAHAQATLAAWAQTILPVVSAGRTSDSAASDSATSDSAAADSATSDSAAADSAAAEDRNLLTVARALVHSARGRTASIGAHFRSDEPGFAQDPAPLSTQNREPAAC